MRSTLLLTLLALAGCATTEQVWDKPGAGNREFSMDQGQCQAQAFGTPFATNMQVALVYNSCMRGKGWDLVERPRR